MAPTTRLKTLPTTRQSKDPDKETKDETKKVPIKRKAMKITTVTASTLTSLRRNANNPSANKAKAVTTENSTAKSSVPEPEVMEADTNLEGENSNLHVEMEAQTISEGVNPNPNEWKVAVNRTTMRKIAKANMSVDDLRNKLRSNAKGVFRTAITRLVTEKIDGVIHEKGVPFDDKILPLCTEIYKLFPQAKTVSSFGVINVWTNTIEEARKVGELSSLLGIPVHTKCSDLDTFWAKISNVDLGFSEEDIMGELSSLGVKAVKRGSSKRLINGVLTAFPTHQVFLQFTNLPPGEVTLGCSIHKVVLHAGSPTICYKCQRYGHKAVTCVNQMVCKRCGSTAHRMSNCNNTPRCVNCKGRHEASSQTCPIRACEIEKRKAMLESRLIQRIKAANPDSSVKIIDKPSESATQETTETTPAPKGKTYASVVTRSLRAEHQDGKSQAVNLPGFTPLPRPNGDKKSKQKEPKPRAEPKRTDEGKRKRSSQDKPLAPEKLKPILALLRSISPEIAALLQSLITMAPLLGGSATKRTSRKISGRKANRGFNVAAN